MEFRGAPCANHDFLCEYGYSWSWGRAQWGSPLQIDVNHGRFRLSFTAPMNGNMALAMAVLLLAKRWQQPDASLKIFYRCISRTLLADGRQLKLSGSG
jgi:hypothetical protein